MKHLNIFLFIIAFTFGNALTQSADSTQEKKQSETAAKPQQVSKQETKNPQDDERSGEMPQKLEGFVDMNANGIDDRIETAGKGKGKGKKQPKDRFVDMDGDGICDGKESAIGLKKLYRKRKGNPNK
jgi:hypothetical protein